MPDPVVVRPAAERDLDVLAAFEVTIAETSFGDQAVSDPAVHRAKLEKALARDPEGVLVAVDGDDRPVGWLWMASNVNFLTQDRYANFRSLAVRPGPDRDVIAQALLDRGLDYARAHGLTEITGKVHVDNQGMRLLYRRAGFEPTSLTMRLRLPADDAG